MWLFTVYLLMICSFLTLCSQILHSFHADRIGATTSFMGKGVMSRVALCLCHVAHEIKTHVKKEVCVLFFAEFIVTRDIMKKFNRSTACKPFFVVHALLN